MRILTLLVAFYSGIAAFGQSWQLRNMAETPFIEDIGQYADLEEQFQIDIKYAMHGASLQYYIANEGLLTTKFEIDAELYKTLKKKVKESIPESALHDEQEEIMAQNRQRIWNEAKIIHYVFYKFDRVFEISAASSSMVSTKFHYHDEGQKQLTGALGYDELHLFTEDNSVSIQLLKHDGGLKYNISISDISTAQSFKFYIETDGNISINESGELKSNSGRMRFRDAAPKTYDAEGNEIKSAFNFNGETLGFSLEPTAKWPITIDPWITNLDSVQAQVLQVETDANGSVYTYLNIMFNGLDRLNKYDLNGNLIWSTTYNSVGHTDGDLEIDEETNTLFLSSISRVAKYDENGINLWETAFAEAWTLEFNCSENQFVGGGNLGPNFSKLHNLDPNTGQSLSQFLQPNDTLHSYGWLNEVRAATSSPSGDYYFLALQHVVKMCPALQLDYQLPNHHDSILYLGPAYHNDTLGFGGSPYSWSEYNAIAVDSQYLYTYDGRKLLQRLAISGAPVDSVEIMDGITIRNGGIIVDDCGNVFIGAQSMVYKLDNSLALLDSIAVSTPIYDLAFGLNNELIAVGNDYVESLSFSHCYKQLCNPPDTFPYNFSPDSVMCLGDSMRLEASGGAEYLWYPDYNISTTDSNIVFVSPDTTTTYNVVIILDSCYFRTGEVTVFVDTITEYIHPSDTTICEGDSVLFNVSGTAATFLVRDTFGQFVENGTEFILKPTQSTFYEIRGTGLDSSACASDYTIEVLEKPFKNDLDTALQCKGIPVEVPYTHNDSVEWSPLDGITFGDSVASIFKKKSGYIYITQRDYGICAWLDSFYLAIAPGPDLFVDPFDSLICRGEQRLLKVSGAKNYIWSPDSIVEQQGEDFLLSTKDTLIVKVIGEDSVGCLDSTYLKFYTKPNAFAHILLTDTTVCQDEPFTIHVQGDDSLIWADSLGITQVGPFSYRLVPKDHRKLTLVSAPENYCPDSSFVNVFVHKISAINQFDTTICRGESVIFKPRIDGNYSLYPNFGITENADNEFVLKPYSSIAYSLVNDVGCIGNDSIKIKVIDCSYFVPNVVTPDGDGKNDQFFIQSDIIETAIGKVYNRWGNLVYENDLQKNPWDCKKANKTVADGTYFYSIDVITKDGESFRLRGEFTLFSK